MFRRFHTAYCLDDVWVIKISVAKLRDFPGNTRLDSIFEPEERLMQIFPTYGNNIRVNLFHLLRGSYVRNYFSYSQNLCYHRRDTVCPEKSFLDHVLFITEGELSIRYSLDYKKLEQYK